MTTPFQYQNEDIRAPSPDSDLVLMLHDHMQVFTSTVGTQTDPEIFYVNGKPARAVQPFRIIPKPNTGQAVIVQTEEDEDEETQTGEIQEQPHTSGWQQAQWTTSEQDPVEQGIEVLGEVEVESEEGQEDIQDEEVEEPESSESEMELQSQETQTELQHLQRQLHLLKEEEQAEAN